jgi:cephalosporin hydroxylase
MNNESKIAAFENEVAQRVKANGTNSTLLKSAGDFVQESIRAQYSYNFSWLGRPIIQYPQDILAVQEIVWSTNPDLIIETGIAHGGSLIMSASMLALLEYRDAAVSGKTVNPNSPSRKVLGIDIDIRPHNREAVEKHYLSPHIEMIQGSSIADDVIAQVREFSSNYKRILVCLDSNHTHSHVLAELEAYAPLVSQGSYCIVFDTVVENLPEELLFGRPWSQGDNPMSAVKEYLKQHPDFEIDDTIDHKLLISVAPSGFLIRR